MPLPRLGNWRGTAAQLIFAATAVKIAAGITVSRWASGAAPLPLSALPSSYYVALLAIFGLSGATLYLGGESDVRARFLGLSLLLFGTLFTDRLVARALPSIPGPLSVVLSALASIQFIAIGPLLLWQFAWVFPRVQSGLIPPWVSPLVTRLAVGASAVLILSNLPTERYRAQWEPIRVLAARLSPNTDDGFFWQVISILTMPSLALLIAKLRYAHADERRRLGWVVGGIVIGSLPMVLHVFLVTAAPRYATFASEPLRSRTIGIVLTLFSLVIPATTAYAVLVDQTLEVRFIIRRAVQYAFARYTVLLLIAGLVAGLVTVVYANRERPLGELLGNSPVSAVALLLVGAVLLWRRSVLEAIDRRFFREQHDAHRILLELVDKSQKAHTARDVMMLITSQVDRALHLERISLLVRDADNDQLQDPEGRVRGLDADGALASLIAGSHTPLDVDLSSDSSALGRLPEIEREWLADAGARLIVPLFGAQGKPLGVLALGDKRSELPFTHEDRQLMMAVAASAALALEQKLHSESPDPDVLPPTRTHAARQCATCGRVQDRQQAACLACGGAVNEALLPAVLAGKFEIERQIGAGGMGVVYRARDLALNRPVAVKVLPRVVPRAAARLRREARAMAMMQHPNLAVIYAMESWRGAPVLVLEYLAGGTVADRIRRSPLTLDETIAVGVIVAEVLHHIHRAGYLHRDVKPSNIGYTDEGVPKLLDFGLVRLVTRLSALSAATETPVTAGPIVESVGAHQGRGSRSFETGIHQVVGTPTYLSPEAINMASPSHGVDLWGLAVTLYEALTGRNPFSAPTVAETFNLITNAEVPDVRHRRPDCSPELATFLASALDADVSKRPQNAAEFVKRLRAAALSSANA